MYINISGLFAVYKSQPQLLYPFHLCINLFIDDTFIKSHFLIFKLSLNSINSISMSSLLFLLIIFTVSGEIISNFERRPWRWPDDNNIKSINVNKSPFFHIFKHKFKIQVVEKIPTIAPSANCICVPYYQCDSNNTIITDGVGIIDVR